MDHWSKLWHAAQSAAPDLLAETLAVTRIAAPTFAEGERAAYVERRLRDLGLQEVGTDDLHNVWGRLPGTGGGPTLLLAAHTDTVFPAGTDVEPRFDGFCWRAPGIRDNSASVALLLQLSRVLDRAGLQLPGDLVLAFPVGEEGLGDLRGMRSLTDRFQGRVDVMCIIDGNLGNICTEGIRVRRLEVVGRTRGGHSWGNFGLPSAIHVLGRMVARISRLEVPLEPKTTFNVGMFAGGTSVNSIAAEARFQLDMRSADDGALRALEQQVRAILREETEAAAGLDLEVRVAGDRPGGQMALAHPVVLAAAAALRAAGIEPRFHAGSTDANIPLSRGIPACCFGVTSGGAVHTLEEYLEPDTLSRGMAALAHWLCLLMADPGGA